jgi:hypothetical protein
VVSFTFFPSRELASFVCSSAIIESLSRQNHSKNLNPGEQQPALAYFYFSFDNALEQDLSTVLRSIIWQICTDGEIPFALQTLFQKGYTTRLNTLELRSLLKAILQGDGNLQGSALDIYGTPVQNKETFLVFDGLDEIPYGPHREAILELLDDLSATTNFGRTHTLVTSRPEKDISDYLSSSRDWLRCSMERYHVQDDIALYISDQIEKHPKLKKLPLDIQFKAKRGLIEGSNGMLVS